MKLVRLLSPIVCIVAICAVFTVPAYLRSNSSANEFSGFVIHGNTQFQLTIPPGFTMGSIISPPLHGGAGLFNSTGWAGYTPAYGYVGSDSFTYSVCQGGNCDTLTADLDVQNNAPTPSGETYSVHGTIYMF